MRAQAVAQKAKLTGPRAGLAAASQTAAGYMKTPGAQYERD